MLIKKINVALLGATGMVGQRFVQLLENHPWFKIACVAASDRSIGKKYSKAVNWIISGDIPNNIADLEVIPPDPKMVGDVTFIFSALPSIIATEVEENFARAGYIVVSNASSHRMDQYVPLLNPEINAEHVALIEEQRHKKNWDGAIVTSPNCTTTILTLSLKPILDEFGISRIIFSSMQAISGAGYPGVPSIEILDNVIPFIRGEEEKTEMETLKILGSKKNFASFKISASCHRVATINGHLIATFVETHRNVEPKVVTDAMKTFKGVPQKLGLPSAPTQPIIVRTEQDRPQPRLDRMAGGGMAVVVGRIRKDSALNGIKYLVFGHNTIRGAAGGAILNAELLRAKGYF